MSNWLVMLISHCLAESKSDTPTLQEPSTTYTRSLTAVLQPVRRTHVSDGRWRTARLGTGELTLGTCFDVVLVCCL